MKAQPTARSLDSGRGFACLDLAGAESCLGLSVPYVADRGGQLDADTLQTRRSNAPTVFVPTRELCH